VAAEMMAAAGAVATAAVASGAVAIPADAIAAAPSVVKPAAPRRVIPEKAKLTRTQKFRLWIGRPLVATMAFATMVAVGLPVIAATYTRDSANPVAWRNVSLYELQGKLDYCFKVPSVGSVFACDYGLVSESGGLAPRKGRIKHTTILKPYPVAGPIIVDAAPQVASAPVQAGSAPAPAPVAVAPGPLTGGGGGGGGKPIVQPTPVPVSYPVINFPAGPMSAIESTCERAKQAAQNQSAAYQQNVERQCEAAKQAYERAHP
jgi:hypothetical protein